MSSEKYEVFTKDNLENYLKELAKQYRKFSGKSFPAEIILVGGAAVITNYGFRDMTTDVDAVIYASSAMKDAINAVADKYNLPNGWLNDDFLRTTSYTNKLNEFSKYYKTFSNVLTVRVVGSEYLIAMKLKAGRKYKNDYSDIIGILTDHQNDGSQISLDDIKKAVINLYSSWDSISISSREFIENVFKNGNFEEMYDTIRKNEIKAHDILVEFENKYPERATESNIESILEILKKNL